MRIPDYLRSRLVRFETMLHRPAPSATRLAESVHTPGRQVAKAVLVDAGGSFVLAVLPATHRIDLPRLADALGVARVGLASVDDLERVFADCETGALPPFGRLYGLTTIVDASLGGGSEIVFVANTRHECVRMRYRDFESIELPLRARFATAISPRQRKLSHRRAG